MRVLSVAVVLLMCLFLFGCVDVGSVVKDTAQSVSGGQVSAGGGSISPEQQRINMCNQLASDSDHWMEANKTSNSLLPSKQTLIDHFTPQYDKYIETKSETPDGARGYVLQVTFGKLIVDRCSLVTFRCWSNEPNCDYGDTMCYPNSPGQECPR